MKYYSPEDCHNAAFENIQRSFSFDGSKDFDTFRRNLGKKFLELLGDMPQKRPSGIDIEKDSISEEFREIRFTFLSEPFAHVPCHLLLPPGMRGPVPVVICLQGHSTGMHISLGRAMYPDDAESIGKGRDIAIQAVREGYAALVIEQRCFGEREGKHPEAGGSFRKCHHPSMSSLLLGRTMIGERVWDVSGAIDMLDYFREIDKEMIICTGNSGGGTVTYYAACFDNRIKIAIPSCAVCNYTDSIGAKNHCQCNYIPGVLKYFDMGDLSCLIAPRNLIVVAGRQDDLFPLTGTQKAFDTIKAIYYRAGMPDACKLLIGNGGHQYYPELVWPELKNCIINVVKGSVDIGS